MKWKSPPVLEALFKGKGLDHGFRAWQRDGLFITLSTLSGGDLHNLICARTKLGEAETLRIGHQIAMALDEASRSKPRASRLKA